MNIDHLSTRQFWAHFSSMVPAIGRIALPPLPSLAYGLDQYFGKLANHSIVSDSEVELVLQCANCRNCTEFRRDEVCETHLGVVCGTARRLANAEVHADFEPNTKSATCIIRLSKR